jgi:hypothetical protein
MSFSCSKLSYRLEDCLLGLHHVCQSEFSELIAEVGKSQKQQKLHSSLYRYHTGCICLQLPLQVLQRSLWQNLMSVCVYHSPTSRHLALILHPGKEMLLELMTFNQGINDEGHASKICQFRVSYFYQFRFVS